MTINVINNSNYDLPSYQTAQSAGMDLRANQKEVIVLQPLERILVPTGIFIALMEGYEAQIRPRSGLAYKHGITVLNSPGTIDSDYRGEIKILLVNLSNVEFEIQPGERIAQMIVSNHEKVVWNVVEKLSDTVRNEAGYGSTGRN